MRRVGKWRDRREQPSDGTTMGGRRVACNAEVNGSERDWAGRFGKGVGYVGPCFLVVGTAWWLQAGTDRTGEFLGQAKNRAAATVPNRSSHTQVPVPGQAARLAAREKKTMTGTSSSQTQHGAESAQDHNRRCGDLDKAKGRESKGFNVPTRGPFFPLLQ